MGFLRSSTCTPVQVDSHRRALIRGWCELIRERLELAREKAAWFRPYGSEDATPGRRFCFVLGRMKWTWRRADRRRDTTGRPADLNVGSTDARKRWFELLRRVIEQGQLVRVRHRYFDGPALLMSEEHYRKLERAAGGDPLLALLGGSDPDSDSPDPEVRGPHR